MDRSTHFSAQDLQRFSERVTACGDVVLTAGEAHKVLGALRHLQEALDIQTALTREVLMYLNRALRAEALLDRIQPIIQDDTTTEGGALLQEVEAALNRRP